MDPKQNNKQTETQTYEAPRVTDYGTLRELTEIGGSLANADVPHGHINSSFPAS
jgi:hypothetical protein